MLGLVGGAPGGQTPHVADPWRGRHCDTAVRAVHATLPFGRPRPSPLPGVRSTRSTRSFEGRPREPCADFASCGVRPRRRSRRLLCAAELIFAGPRAACDSSHTLRTALRPIVTRRSWPAVGATPAPWSEQPGLHRNSKGLREGGHTEGAGAGHARLVRQRPDAVAEHERVAHAVARRRPPLWAGRLAAAAPGSSR